MNEQPTEPSENKSAIEDLPVTNMEEAEQVKGGGTITVRKSGYDPQE